MYLAKRLLILLHKWWRRTRDLLRNEKNVDSLSWVPLSHNNPHRRSYFEDISRKMDSRTMEMDG